MEDYVVRKRLYDEIQSHAGVPEITDAPENSILTQFLIIAEWEAQDGVRWISKISGDAFRSLPPWRERGLAAEVLHGDWYDEEQE
jgi:hypothetical protein